MSISASIGISLVVYVVLFPVGSISSVLLAGVSGAAAVLRLRSCSSFFCLRICLVVSLRRRLPSAEVTVFLKLLRRAIHLKSIIIDNQKISFHVAYHILASRQTLATYLPLLLQLYYDYEQVCSREIVYKFCQGPCHDRNVSQGLRSVSVL